MSTLPAILLIQSRQPGNTAIGTGFIIHHADGSSYILTCAHVLRDMGGPEEVMVARQPAELLAIGEEHGLDLAVLRVAQLAGRPPLSLRSGGSRGQAVSIEGFSKYIQYHPLETLSGHLTHPFRLADSGQQHYVTAWSIAIDGDQKLLGGYSGSPVCDAASGTALGVMFTRDGEQQGRAISIEALAYIWPQMPAGLVEPAPDSQPAPAHEPPAAPAAASPHLVLPGALIDFGRDNTIGDIIIGDIAGRDIVSIASAAPGASPQQPAHISVYLAAHPRLNGKAYGQQDELLIDWSRDFLDGDPPPELWDRALIRDLQRLQDTCRCEGKRLIKLRAFARNTAALAFGHMFNQRSGFHIHYSDNRDTLWRTDEPTSAPSPLTRIDTVMSPAGRDLVLELALTTSARNVSEPVDAWLGAPRPSAAPADPAPEAQIDRVKWRQGLISAFNDSELRDLCFDLRVDYENLPGQSKSDKARELIDYAGRNNRSAEILAACRALRPHVDWGAAPNQAKTHVTSVGRRILLVRERQDQDLTPAEGAAIARQVCDLVAREGSLDGSVHLFGALPMGVALLIGWGMKAGQSVQYYDLNGKLYQPTYRLQG